MNISALIGLTLTECTLSNRKDEIVFVTDSGKKYHLFHEADGGESVTVEDICGDLADLIGSPITQAEESTSGDNPPSVKIKYQDSFTWTFYRLATAKGLVVIRWYGESNGFYSEAVYFGEMS